MSSILEVIKARRSHRIYQDTPVKEDDLGKILEAGRYAPSGGNHQSTHFIVIKNRIILDEIVTLVTEEFAGMEANEDQYISVQNSIRKAKSGKYPFFYNAPVLIVVTNKRAYQNALADSACALQNMMLEATELNLGSCWINQLRWLDGNPVIDHYLRGLGLKEDETVCGGLALGYSGTTDLQPREPKGNVITYVN